MADPKKIEIKTTIEADGVDRALKTLGLALGDAQATTTLVLFCEERRPDGRLSLAGHDLIMRLRWRLRVAPANQADATNDCTVKVRPVVGDLDPLRDSKGPGDTDKFEGDWSPAKRVNSFSRRVEGLPGERLAAVLSTSAPVAGLLSRGQLDLLRSVLGSGVPAGLRCLPPVLATTWELGHKREAELWSVRDLHFLEISERAEPAAAAGAQAAQLAFVRGLAVEPSTGDSKTSRVLALLTS